MNSPLALTDIDDAEFQTAGIPIAALGLRATNPADWPLIEHEVRHTDGAVVIARDGRILRKGVILNPSAAAIKAVAVDGGTRHIWRAVILTIVPMS